MNTTNEYQAKLQAISKTQDQVLMVGGKSQIVPLRVPTQGEYVIIDALNMVFSVDTFTTYEMRKLKVTPKDLFTRELDDEQRTTLTDMVVNCIAHNMGKIFGKTFATLTQKSVGIHYYKQAYFVSSEEKEILLNIGIGGQNETVFISLTGNGCKLAELGWEQRLYDFLNTAVGAKISRIDLAHDDLKGAYSSFDWANQKESDDAFVLSKTRNRPGCTIAGEFKHGDPYNKGLTLYVGNRKNGKLIRCYEKGKQLGDPNSKWFRSELEIHSKKRVIPFDVLLDPTGFFCGAYPYCLELITLAKKHWGDTMPQTLQRMPAVKQETKVSLFRVIQIFKNQFGKHLKSLGEIFTKPDDKPNYEKIFKMLVTSKEENYYPKRLRLPANYFNSPINDRLGLIIDFEREFMELSHEEYMRYLKLQQKQEKERRMQIMEEEVMNFFAYGTPIKSDVLWSDIGHQ